MQQPWLATRADKPITMVQFGQGNFLRAFVDDMVDIANEKGVMQTDIAVVKATPLGSLNAYQDQNSAYTVLLRGNVRGRAEESARIVRCLRMPINPYQDYAAFETLATEEELRLVVSNTTEAGIATDERDAFALSPPPSFPAKVVKFLYRRFSYFAGDPDKGLVFLPTELIEDNGDALRACVLSLCQRWSLPPAFVHWVEESCLFCNTLVDRIVTGYPRTGADEIFRRLGYRDALLTVAEPFALWVIACKDTERIKALLPLDRAGLPVRFVDDLTPYREMKVRLLNGAHTGAMPSALLCGIPIVRDALHDRDIRRFLDGLLQEILPTVPLDRAEAEAFAEDVLRRFDNPFIDHQILSIALNSSAKWKARNLPSLLDAYRRAGSLPPHLTFSFAALIKMIEREDVKDTEEVKAFFQERKGWEASPLFIEAYIRQFFGSALAALPGFIDTVSDIITEIEEKGCRAALQARFPAE